MRTLTIAGAVLLLSTSSLALAQDQETDPVEETDMVEETVTDPVEGGVIEDNEDFAAIETPEGGPQSEFARQVVERAQDPSREGGIGQWVSQNAPGAAIAAEARAGGREAAAQGRAQGALARQGAAAAQQNAAAARTSSSAVVETAMSARGNASAVVEQAQAVRQNAQAAAEQANAARQNGQAVAEQARAARDAAAAARGR